MSEIFLPGVYKNLSHYGNSAADIDSSYPTALADILGLTLFQTAQDEISQWPGYAATPLYELRGLATAIGVANILYKDEGPRFGLDSFKALGGAYEVLCILQQQASAVLQRQVSFAEIRNGSLQDVTKDITVVTATDGNHGRAVAWGAKLFGCRCQIYIHAEVSPFRAQAMARYGAEIHRLDSNYDASVRQAADDAERFGWFVASDTSYTGYMEFPRQVMAGYSLIGAEIVAQLDKQIPPSHIFIQGGVGGIAAALCGYFWQVWGHNRPRFIVVEPDRADCLLASAKNARPTAIDISEETIMAGLSCGEVSLLAWQILAQGVNDFIAISDDLVAPTMRLLAQTPFADPPIVAGESAVAGLAALIAASEKDQGELARTLGLDEQSRVLVVGTEGATDPEIYQAIMS